MIKFLNDSCEKPYIILKQKYLEAVSAKQRLVEAISIASFSSNTSEVDTRFVNLKFVDGNQFIFFTNYKSPKSIQFESHNQIAVSMYWQSTNTQIRMKAYIKKTSKEFNNNYFLNRSKEKNALAISSNQSEPIASYQEVKDQFNNSLRYDNLSECPDYWGGYSFTPYYFEFWEGHESRLNKRNVYKIENNDWNHFISQP